MSEAEEADAAESTTTVSAGRPRGTAMSGSCSRPRLCRPSPRDSDLVPYWVYTGLAGTPASKVDRIERYVPVLPLSHDEARLEALRRSLAVYRMLIGHARQEELLAWLMHYVEGSGMSTADINELVQELTIDLSPRGGEQPRLVGEHAIGGVE